MVRLAMLAAVAIAGLAALRTMVVIFPALRFDVDPLFTDAAVAGIGPAHTLTLDACTLLLSAFVLAVCARRARWADATACGLALLPAAVISLHGTSSPFGADDLWRGSGWLAAMVGAVALWCAARTLPRGPALRAALLAVLLCAAGPLVVRAGMQLVVEHSADVAWYTANKASLLASRGWAPDSAQALQYERRLMQLEATGWFGLSNILSSLLGAMAVALCGLALASWRTLERGTAVLLLAVGVAGAAVVGINGSKGALVALGLGAGVALLASRSERSARVLQAAGVAAVALAVLAVVARGMMGEALGERSLLFRWQYLQGAVGTWLDAPLTGAGPAGFAQVFLQFRPEHAPEEVQSAHSMWADWLAALGVAGLAWTGLVLAWVWQAGRATLASRNERAAPATLGRNFMGAALAAALAACALASVADLHALDGVGLVARAVGAGLAVALVVALVQALETPSRAAAAALFGAALLLAVHAQIEMTLWNPGSVGWILAMLALAGAVPASSEPPRGAPACMALAVLGVLACAANAALMGALPAAQLEGVLQRAAALVVQGKGSPQSRMDAARLLADAPGVPPPWRDRPLLLAAALQQWASALAAMPTNAPELKADVPAALAAVAAIVDRSRTEPVCGAAQVVALQALRGDAAPEVRNDAATALRTFAALQLSMNPRDTQAWLNLAQGSAAMGLMPEAQRAYQRALQADDTFVLDPMRQLPAAQRTDIEARASRPR